MTGEIVTTLIPQRIRTKYVPERSVSRADSAVAFVHAKWSPYVLLGLVFALNLVETLYESHRGVAVTSRGVELASGMHWLEGGSVFENHDVSNVVAVYGFSTAYFFVFPLLVLLTGMVLARRPSARAFRVFATAVAIEYACSLPFFLLFPVPERWTYPDANAILLSDLWNSHLIELFRPISALDNCFPSFHTSLSVLVVVCCFVYRVGYRFVAAPLAAMVLLSTYSLGIHWIGDIASGAALAAISMAAAHRVAGREA